MAADSVAVQVSEEVMEVAMGVVMKMDLGEVVEIVQVREVTQQEVRMQ